MDLFAETIKEHFEEESSSTRKLFTNPESNRKGAQLLLTSHDITTMNSRVFRRDKLKDRMEEAIERAKRQYEEYGDVAPSKRCPATKVFQLVEELKRYLQF